MLLLRKSCLPFSRYLLPLLRVRVVLTFSERLFTFVKRPGDPRPAFIFAIFLLIFSTILLSFSSLAGRYNHRSSGDYRFQMIQDAGGGEVFCNGFCICCRLIADPSHDSGRSARGSTRIGNERCSLTFLLVLR